MISSKIITLKDWSNEDDGCYTSSIGEFFSVNKNFNVECIESCREELAMSWNRNKRYIGFYDHRLNIHDINKFFEIIENKLKLKQKSIIYQCRIDEEIDSSKVLIKVSPFWIKSPMRRGFFTLFLRCAAIHYNGKNINYALRYYQLTKRINKAVKLFLNGYTFTRSKIPQWNIVDTLYRTRNCKLILRKNK